MVAAAHSMLDLEAMLPLFTITAVLGALLIYFALRSWKCCPNGGSTLHKLPAPPAVPGVPLLGNLLQLKEKKPYKLFAEWAEIYGAIYTIKLGSSSLAVLNSADVAKEAMITRFSSISTRKLSSAMNVITQNKSMVATSDYDDFHKMVKRHAITGALGTNALKKHRCHRDTMVENISKRLHAHSKSSPFQAANFRQTFDSELFAFSLRATLGDNIESVHIKELGTTFAQEEMHQVLVTDIMEAAIEVDWRDFFPYLSWIPNKGFETRVQHIHSRRIATVKALIAEQTKKIAAGKRLNCFLNYLLTEAKDLSEDLLAMLIWEDIGEASDTVATTAEWAMHELAKNSTHQLRLFNEIRRICGENKITEEDVPQLPYLNAVFHETLRKYSPGALIAPRYVHEDTQIGGCYIPAGTEVLVNIYGCNMDKNKWERPEEWNPERFLDEKYVQSDLYKTMSFGAGRRVCTGSQLAMLIVTTTVGRLVQEFEWKLADGEEENTDDTDPEVLTSRKLHPLYVIPTPRVGV